LDDLAILRSANTVRAYAFDLDRWVDFCRQQEIDAFRARPRLAIEFVRVERQRLYRTDKTISARTVVRRLTAIRQWYAYLALEPEETGVRRNPIPSGSAIRTGTGVIANRPALLRYDRSLPQVLSADEMDGFAEHLTATRYRDRAIFWLLKDGGMRISELLSLRLADVNWGKHVLTIRPGKGKRERLVPVTQQAITALSNYIRLERPRPLHHEIVFVNLGRRGFGQPFRYRSWVASCEQARKAACTPRVHAHAFRHSSPRTWQRAQCLSTHFNAYSATATWTPS
jgi:site-specific recombinase XerD